MTVYIVINVMEFALVIFLVWLCRRDAFKRGYEKAIADQKSFGEKCYQRGRSDESSWWIAADLDINAERQSMWKKEHGR